MRRCRALILGSLSLLLCAAGVACGSAPVVPRMSVDELKSLLGSPTAIVLDVRTGADWDRSASKIRGALRKDPGTVDDWAATLPKDKTLVLYCA